MRNYTTQKEAAAKENAEILPICAALESELAGLDAEEKANCCAWGNGNADAC